MMALLLKVSSLQGETRQDYYYEVDTLDYDNRYEYYDLDSVQMELEHNAQMMIDLIRALEIDEQ